MPVVAVLASMAADSFTTGPGGTNIMDSETHATGIRLFLAREAHRNVDGPRARRPARSVGAAPSTLRLRDYVPRFVDVATETLRSNAYDGDVRVRAAQFARVHALERLAEDFHLDEVQREFDHLEGVVGEYVRPTGVAHRLLCTAIAEAREIAVAAYAEQSGRRWKEERPTATLAKTAVDDDVNAKGRSRAS